MKTILTFVLALLTVIGPDHPRRRGQAHGWRLQPGATDHHAQAGPDPRRRTDPGPAPRGRPPPPRAAPAAGSGPWPGLAAGGLLASLFFGGAFEGMAGMDWLLIGALAIGAFFLFRALRKRAAAGPIPAMGRMGPAGAAAGPAGYGAMGGFDPQATSGPGDQRCRCGPGASLV